MHFQSIILRRERPSEPDAVTGVTVRYADGTQESVDCMDDREQVIREVEGFIFAERRAYIVPTGSGARAVNARDWEEALAIARDLFRFSE